jgi:putative transposase
MGVKQVIVLKLEPSPEQYQALMETLEAFNAGCQYAADVAYEKRCANKVALQPMVYGPLRQRFGLSAQMAIRAIDKAVEAYKREKRVHVRFQPHGAMVYDERIMTFKGPTHVSLLSLSGRLRILMRYGAYQAARLDRAQGQADLILRGETFFLAVTVDLPSPPEIEPHGALGVDLGITEIATDSDGHAYSGEAVKTVRRRLKRIRALLQSRGTKSARRHLRKIKRRQSRFVRNSNHVIAKQLVERACATGRALSLEDLRGIRERSNGFSRDLRWLLGNWAFDQLARFVQYKAEAASVPVLFVDPRNTSRTCSRCGYCDKANRKSQAQFLCLQCGLDINADLNAALNIQARAHQSERLLSRRGLWGQPGTSHSTSVAVVI